MILTSTQLERLKQGGSNNWAQYVTQYTGETIDWANSAGLVKSRTRTNGILGLWTQYSWREYFVRGSMFATMLITAYAADYLARDYLTDEDDEQLKNISTRIACGFFGFVSGGIATHEIVVRPKINRRRQHVAKRAEQIHSINKLIELFTKIPGNYGASLAEADKWVALIHRHKAEIQTMALPTNRTGDAAQNLKLRADMMAILVDKLSTDLSELKKDPSPSQYLITFNKWNMNLTELMESHSLNQSDEKSKSKRIT